MQLGIDARGDDVLRGAERCLAYVDGVLLDAGGHPRDRGG
jgi:hypothetical protein